VRYLGALLATVVGLLCVGCAAVAAAGDHAAQGGGAAAGGAASLLFGLTGPIGAIVAGVCGWLGGLLFTPPHSAGGAPASGGGFTLTFVVLVAGGVLMLRAWGHAPLILKAAWATFKVSARGLLGGLQRPQ